MSDNAAGVVLAQWARDAQENTDGDAADRAASFMLGWDSEAGSSRGPAPPSYTAAYPDEYEDGRRTYRTARDVAVALSGVRR